MSNTDGAVAIVSWEARHAAAWRSLNEDWLSAGGYALEPKDQQVLGDPRGAVLDKGGVIFIAERGDEAVGCCSLMAMADGGYEVGKMAVLEAARGLNLGWRLLEACEAAARGQGAPRLYLETNAAQTHAIALYRRFGFIDLPPQPTPYARCNVWMEKRL
ncbi:MAG: GNAT family N-acetyltransferase [Alphaproteobacteria bacterium]|jgi:putative acetyltransferase|nr:GNAT family N-acetyltransferase [Alphaproteobacteria bacterium]MBU2041147.1 GNAT family N-acetyltransferase [Alphaproteobacteria bacterium]MBU2124898.1 GNAT family N-acetyltransferase [Alphaproteobacteria bacterium]MBU2209463.1 GNAT family N-acetyltransferase [Alphaproteobacteria bacterium]MBU2292384.1 GNAT family N-acetyltransferase [Alphaproteobacteria bacterium]